MGELALKKIQAGLEGAGTRGTIVVPSRPWYGTMTINRDQARRYANEDRGVFTKYFRANPKLIEAGWKYEADVTPEDLPYFCEMFMQGGVAPVGTAGTGFLWTYAPDMTADLIRTRTLYAGDDAVQWRGAFGVADTMDITHDLNDALRMELNGFVQDWVPGTSSFLTTLFAGGFSALSDRTVESIMGYQSKLFIDAAGGTFGTTQVTGKLIAAKLGYHLNNKRKYFGDNLNYALQKLGRGERDITAQITFEGLNQAEFADHFNNVEKLLRVQFLGTPIIGTSFGTVNGAIAAGTTLSAITTNALTAAIPGGVGISVGGQVFTVAPAGAAAAATSVPVISTTTQVAIANAAVVMAAKTINFDFWGFWDNFVIGSRETNTTFQLNLMGVYDATAGFDHRIIVQNQNNQAAGVS